MRSTLQYSTVATHSSICYQVQKHWSVDQCSAYFKLILLPDHLWQLCVRVQHRPLLLRLSSQALQTE
jgi:hypothetical protein